jgi:hypothetical protein
MNLQYKALSMFIPQAVQELNVYNLECLAIVSVLFI